MQTVVVPRAPACGGRYVKSTAAGAFRTGVCYAGGSIDWRKRGFSNPVAHGPERGHGLVCLNFMRLGIWGRREVNRVASGFVS